MENMYFHVYRDCMVRGLRKVIVELFDANGGLIDRTRMFAGVRFEKRLARRKQRMLKRAAILITG